jgi:cytochrome c oxidase cbb3-type subunit 3
VSSGTEQSSEKPQSSQLERVATGGQVEDVVPEGHEYDGIQEYDNPIPAWLSYIFIGTIIWGGVYLAGRAMGIIPSWDLQLENDQQALLETRLEAESNKKKITREMLVSAVGGEERLAEGQKLFSNNCMQCHGQNGGGMVGPNLTDQYWIHGANLKSIYAVIQNGANNQKMPSWEGRLSQEEMISVTAYVRSLQETSVDGEPPEGDKWIEKDGKFVPADQG